MYKAKPIFTTNVTVPEVYFNKAMIKLQLLDRATYRKQIVTPIFWTNRIPTAATCGVYTYFNPEFYVDYCENVLQRVFTHAHEIKHIWLRHPQRGKVFRMRDYFAKDLPFIHRIYNEAADIVINADNVALGMEPPKGVIFDSRFNRNSSVDAVYATLIKEYLAKQEEEKSFPPPPSEESEEQEESAADESQEDEQESDEGQDDDEQDSDEGQDGSEDDDSDEESTGSDEDEESEGTGEADDGDPQPTDSDGFDDHFEPQYEGTPEEQKEAQEEDEKRIEKDVDEAIDDAEREGMPNMGKGFVQAGFRHCDPCNPSGINWQERLANVMTRPGAGGEPNWGRINRRKLMTTGVVTPMRKGSINRLIITSDISSSVDTTQRNRFHTEFAVVADMLKPVNGTLILWTNTEVVDTTTCMNGAEIMAAESPMYGGNRLCASLDWLRENGITDGDVHLVFTDGYTPLEDYQKFTAAGAIFVLDSQPDAWVMDMINQTGAEYIVMT